MSQALEALALGLSLGPACLASCGPILLPWLAAAGRPLKGTAQLFALFLAGRLAGYLMFAAVAWHVGKTLPADSGFRGALFALAHLGLAAWMISYALPLLPRSSICPAARTSRTRSIFRTNGPALLGLLTGLSFCPPFLTAGLRAADARTLAGAEFFFLLFFAGTSAWLAPAIGMGCLRRVANAAIVSRMIMLVLGCWYGYMGVIGIERSIAHG